MPKFKYVGKEEQNLAQVGIVKPGQVIEVTKEIGVQLQKHAPEQFEPVTETGQKAKDASAS